MVNRSRSVAKKSGFALIMDDDRRVRSGIKPPVEAETG
jgi:hypothetical protein